MRRRLVSRVCRRATSKARFGVVFYGDARPWELEPYVTDFVVDGIGVRILLTRDSGMHTGGWFRNPDYERCWHLSISFRDPSGLVTLPKHDDLTREIVTEIFRGSRNLLWVEGPKSTDPEIRALDVWHYRLMCDPHWQPIKPRGEVYSSEFTERGWRSFSEIHGHKPLMTHEA